jgi:hypothetical protein
MITAEEESESIKDFLRLVMAKVGNRPVRVMIDKSSAEMKAIRELAETAPGGVHLMEAMDRGWYGCELPTHHI